MPFQPNRIVRLDAARGGEAGFTLIELLIALALSLILIWGLLNLFDQNTSIAHTQNEIAEMQQAQRIVQYEVSRSLRMAGRGGMPLVDVANGLAIALRDNVGEGEYIADGNAGTPEIYPGTDVLTLRGAFSSPVYQLTVVDGGANMNLDNADTPTSGFFIVAAQTPAGIPQDLTLLADAIDQDLPQALIVVDANNELQYAVVELDSGNSVINNDGTITVGFTVQGGAHNDAYNALYPANSFSASTLANVSTVAVLEEYRYYVRKTNLGEQELPQLVRARVYPGTDEVYAGNEANWAVDLAENIFDLQIAFGVDFDGDGIATEGVPDTETPPSADEWAYNDAEDDFDDDWSVGRPLDARITTLARVARRDFRYTVPDVADKLENHVYEDDYVLNTDIGRSYRRRVLPTVISLRNL